MPSALDAEAVRIVERAKRGARRVAGPSDVDLEPATLDHLHGDARLVLDHAETDGSAERVTVRARTNVPEPPAVAKDRLATVEQRLRVIEEELGEPSPRRAGVSPGEQRLAPDEAPRLVPGDRELKATLERRIGIANVMTPAAVAFLSSRCPLTCRSITRKDTIPFKMKHASTIRYGCAC